MKNALLSIAYVFVLFITLMLMNISLVWFLNNILFEMLDWFFGLRLWIQILALVFGGFLVFRVAVTVYEVLVRISVGIVFSFFPANWFTVAISIVFCLLNAGSLIYTFWSLITEWSFGRVIAFIIVSGFILSLHTAFIPTGGQKEESSYA
jgi:hypothetical protein